MKTKNTILIGALLVLACNIIQAQVKIGFKGGYNVASSNFLFNYEATGLPTISSIDLIQLIIPVEININQHYSLQPEFHFKQSGNHMKAFGDRTTRSNTINYWGIGCMNKFRLETKQITPYVLIGLQSNFASDGKYRYIDPDSMEIFGEYKEDKIFFEDIGLNRFDVNIRVGAGLAMKVRKAELLFEVTYDKGMIDMDKNELVSAYNERGIGIMIGLMKNIGSKK